MVVRCEMARFLKDGLRIVTSHEPASGVVALGSEGASDKSATATRDVRPLKLGDRLGSLPRKDFCEECTKR